MAYSSDYVRIQPDRSRSRDDPPMWRHSNQSRPWNHHYRDAWRSVPPVRDTRRVLISVNLDEYWLVSIWTRSVPSSLNWDMTTWTWQLAVNFRAWAAWRKSLCSPIMSSSIRHMYDLLWWKHCSTTSASTFTTPGIASSNTRLWIFVGKISRATHSLWGTTTSYLTYFMNITHVVLRVRKWESYSPMNFARSWIRTNHTSCGWVATKHSPTTTCSRESIKNKFTGALLADCRCYHICPLFLLTLIFCCCCTSFSQHE